MLRIAPVMYNPMRDTSATAEAAFQRKAAPADRSFGILVDADAALRSLLCERSVAEMENGNDTIP